MSANFPASRNEREKRAPVRIPFARATRCHPEAPSFGAEGAIQSVGAIGAASDSTDPSARKERGPQDDKREGAIQGRGWGDMAPFDLALAHSPLALGWRMYIPGFFMEYLLLPPGPFGFAQDKLRPGLRVFGE